MRQATTIGISAALEGILALLLDGPPAVLVGWIAACTGIVAISCALGFTPLLGKREDGTLPWWSIGLFWPWHLFVRGLARVNRRLRGGPRYSEVHPGWWVGGWPDEASPEIDGAAILDLTCELPRRRDGAYLCVPTWDGTAPTLDGLERAVAWAVERREAGERVLIHCAHGRGRSVTVLVAALVAAGLHPTWQAAYAHVQTVRSVLLTRDQQALLERWEAGREASAVAV